jgi:hypothetical protein
MRSLLDVNNEIIGERSKNKRALLRQIVSYLETNPDAGFIQKEQNRLKNELKAINDRRPKAVHLTNSLDEKANKEYKKKLEAHETLYGTKKKKAQLKVINYILKN